MARSSKKSKIEKVEPTAFASEAEAAAWFDSPAGRRHASRVLREAVREGTLIVETGLPDPAKLQKLMEGARQAVTKAISLRISQGDLEEAQRVAKRRGVGYQTVLKEIISAGLKRAG